MAVPADLMFTLGVINWPGGLDLNKVQKLLNVHVSDQCLVLDEEKSIKAGS